MKGTFTFGVRDVQLSGPQPGLWPCLAWPPRWLWPRVTEAEVGQGSIWNKIDENVKVLRMSLPIVESLSGLQESIFSLVRGLQLNSRKKYKKHAEFY